MLLLLVALKKDDEDEATKTCRQWLLLKISVYAVTEAVSSELGQFNFFKNIVIKLLL